MEINEERSNLPANYIFPWTEKEREGKRGGVHVLGLGTNIYENGPHLYKQGTGTDKCTNYIDHN